MRVHNVIHFDMNVILDVEVADKLRKNKKLESYLLSYKHEIGLKRKLDQFFNYGINDIVCIAYALRNIFAHGELTATSVGTETEQKRKVFIDLANSILDYCDDTFTKCINKL